MRAGFASQGAAGHARMAGITAGSRPDHSRPRITRRCSAVRRETASGEMPRRAWPPCAMSVMAS
ncbi:hypothetical protein T492DRAFT_197518 [Pavlovales sp. CCMP2436]|nr:hypothetical protein T492DRAFT_197518 [Pavlovales sp. CCMP2436]